MSTELVPCPNSYHGVMGNQCRLCWDSPSGEVTAAMSVEYMLLDMNNLSYSRGFPDPWPDAVDALRDRHGYDRR